MMKNLVKAAVLALAFVATAPKADAVTILVFGQTGLASTITGTATGGTSTTISGTDISIIVTAIENGAPQLAFLTLSATSTSAAVVMAGNVTQNFAGSFTITTLAGGGGTNLLSGSFTDSTFGAIGGTGLTLTAAGPPDMVSFSSDVITSLGLPRSINLAFSNVSPAVSVDGSTIASFTSAIAGNFDASAVPEPSTMVLLGMGAFSLGGYAIRRRRVKA